MHVIRRTKNSQVNYIYIEIYIEIRCMLTDTDTHPFVPIKMHNAFIFYLFVQFLCPPISVNDSVQLIIQKIYYDYTFKKHFKTRKTRKPVKKH